MQRQYHSVSEVLAPEFGHFARKTVQKKYACESHLPLKVMAVVFVQVPCLIYFNFFILNSVWFDCTWYFTLWREFNICVLLWKCERSRKKPKTDIPINASAKLTVCLLPHLPTPRNCCKTVMFGLCWFSEQQWLTGKQFWLSHAVAKNVVPEFSGGLPLQEIAATCLEGSARLEGGPRKLFAATGGSSANGAVGARTRASATILYFLVLWGIWGLCSGSLFSFHHRCREGSAFINKLDWASWSV